MLRLRLCSQRQDVGDVARVEHARLQDLLEGEGVDPGENALPEARHAFAHHVPDAADLLGAHTHEQAQHEVCFKKHAIDELKRLHALLDGGYLRHLTNAQAQAMADARLPKELLQRARNEVEHRAHLLGRVSADHNEEFALASRLADQFEKYPSFCGGGLTPLDGDGFCHVQEGEDDGFCEPWEHGGADDDRLVLDRRRIPPRAPPEMFDLSGHHHRPHALLFAFGQAIEDRTADRLARGGTHRMWCTLYGKK